MPRRRFSQGAIKPIREMLEEIEDEENQQIQLEKGELKHKRLEQKKRSLKNKAKKKHERKGKKGAAKTRKSKAKQINPEIVLENDDDSLCNTDDDFLELSREEQLERLKEGDLKGSGRICFDFFLYFLDQKGKRNYN